MPVMIRPMPVAQGLQPNQAPNPAPASGKTFLIVAGLAVGGYLLYRHFHKGSVELSGTEPVEVDDDHEED